MKTVVHRRKGCKLRGLLQPGPLRRTWAWWSAGIVDIEKSSGVAIRRKRGSQVVDNLVVKV